MTAAVVGDIGVSESELRELYRRHDGVVRQVADEIGEAVHVVRRRLIKYGIHESTSYLTHDLEEVLPHDVGLSHLRCGSCRAKITEHPCSECGWTPTDQQSTLGDYEGGDD